MGLIRERGSKSEEESFISDQSKVKDINNIADDLSEAAS